MIILRYELRRYRTYIIVWSLALAACIFVLTPVYNSMMQGADSISARFGNGGFLTALGVSMELLKLPIGMYAFLSNFLMLGGGIYGMLLGLRLYTDECTEGTAEFLFTKPVNRNQIFQSKLLCLIAAVSIMGICFMAASFATMSIFHPGYRAWELFLIALSFFLHSMLFGAVGVLAGIRFPKNRSPILTASLTVFSCYGITEFARTVDMRAISYLSPFSFFAATEIHRRGFYELDYLIWYAVVLAVCLFSARKILNRRDITLIG